jgi:hypothetical protein
MYPTRYVVVIALASLDRFRLAVGTGSHPIAAHAPDRILVHLHYCMLVHCLSIRTCILLPNYYLKVEERKKGVNAASTIAFKEGKTTP